MQATSFFNGVSGLKSFSQGLNIVADNLANSNTYGYKASRAEFADVLYRELNYTGSDLTTEFDQVGQGATVWAHQLMNQGAIQETGRTLDLAIDGNGFFTVKKLDTGALYYTRAGQFGLDGLVGQEGFIINDQGYRLQGFAIGDDGEPIVDELIDLQIPVDNLPGEATTIIGLGVNLNPADTRVNQVATAIDPTNSGTYNYSSSTTVYDADGGTHQISVYYQRVDDYAGTVPEGGQTVWKASTFETQNSAQTANPAAPANTFYLHFTNTGALAGVTDSTGATVSADSIGLTMDFGEAGQQAITLDFAPGGGQATTQVAAGYSISTNTQDGFAEGSLESVSVSEDGFVTAYYSNGEMVDVGVVALTTFASPGNLRREGDNLWAYDAAAGEIWVGQPTDEAFALGAIEDQSLETSTVDTATEMMNMIIYQRAFQANSKTVNTSDEMIKTAINMKT